MHGRAVTNATPGRYNMPLSGRHIRRDNRPPGGNSPLKVNPTPWRPFSHVERPMISKPSKPVLDPEAMDHPGQVLKPRIRREWTWLLLAGVFLGVSGGHRYLREWQ